MEAVGRSNSFNDHFMAQLLNLSVNREQTQLKSTVRDCSTNLVVLDCIFHDLTKIFMNNKYIHHSVYNVISMNIYIFL